MAEPYSGTTLRLEDQEDDLVVIADSPAAPADMCNVTVGRVIGAGFQPAPFAAWAMSPDTLRDLADLIEEEGDRG